MLLTVSVLRNAEIEALVEPDILMKDDGYEGRFAKAYIHDEIPWMDLRHEVRDLMILAVPDIVLFQDDLSFEDVEIPADGMEACWAVENTFKAPSAEEITVISSGSVPVESIGAEELAVITEGNPQVRFSFGPQEVYRSGWRVCFLF